MNKSSVVSLACALASLVLAGPPAARADEGMWLFNAPPREQLKARHGFEPGDAWLEHLMKASVKFGTASGSFVSPNGLVLTNHHVGRSRVQQLSTPERDLMKHGFYARTPAEELKCSGITLSVLQSIEDVTAQLAAAAPPSAGAEVRRRAIAEIERVSREQTGLHSTVVSLYEGGRAHLYRMKRYTDVRLVFAPEFDVAHFGGDVDNFEYPRFCLDVCFFRVYENDRPLQTPDYLRWSAAGPREGELVFASGHPGNTDRLQTLAQREYLRDVQLPFLLEGHRRNEVVLKNWAARDAENARRAARILLPIENSRKRADGQLAALQDAAFISRLQRAEAELKREFLAAGKTEAAAAFDRIATVQAEQARHFVRHQLLVTGDAFSSQSGVLARNLISTAGSSRAGGPAAPGATQDANPATQAAEAAQVAQAAADTFFEDLEIVRLASALTRMTERLGYADPVVQHVLAGKSPQARATELTRGTRVRDAAFRQQITAGGAAAIAATDDPWLVALRGIDQEVSALRRRRAEQVEAIRVAHTAIAEARFQLRGTTSYPDATGTLRLSYGLVRGYSGADVNAPAMTDFAGLYRRAEKHAQQYPFTLPPRWQQNAGKINLATPLDFIATTDTVGGNSGSPLVNRAGEFVGINFDSDLLAQSRAFAYDEERGRSIIVHSVAIEEALRGIYGAEALLQELRGAAKAPATGR